MTTPPLSSPTSPVPTPRRRYLDPMDRVSELLFGLIMVLTFTGTLSVADAGRETVREMLVAALGCNLAWGLVDGVMYLMACLAERGRAFLYFEDGGPLAFLGFRKPAPTRTASEMEKSFLRPVAVKEALGVK